MRFIFFIQQLFLSLQRIHQRALALTTYDKFLNLSDRMHFPTQQIITSNLESYHILIIEKRFPVWANEYTMSQKSHDSSRHFLRHYLQKVALYLSLLLSNNAEFRRCGYHKVKFLYSMNKLSRSWLVLLQQLNIKLSFVKCRPLRNYPPLGWYARLPCYAE